MCTAIAWNNGEFYFGRNMDLDYQFNQQVTIVPRAYSFSFKKENQIGAGHFAMIGMAMVIDNYPLFAEAVNEKGLCVAGLNFEGYAYNSPETVSDKHNIAAYEVIPWLLAQCSNVKQAKELLTNTNIVAIAFKEDLPWPTLHWIISDKQGSIVFEFTKDGGKVFDNPFGVMTNNPTFDFHLTNLANYINCSPKYASNNFSPEIDIFPLGVGAGSYGLPGDTSTTSRFVRAVFTKINSVCNKTEEDSVAHFFHILDSVSMQKGSTITKNGVVDITIYSACVNVDRGVYYYKTYNNNQISAVNINNANLENDELIIYPLVTTQQINYIN